MTKKTNVIKKKAKKKVKTIDISKLNIDDIDFSKVDELNEILESISGGNLYAHAACSGYSAGCSTSRSGNPTGIRTYCC